jgi:hypothetical protein
MTVPLLPRSGDRRLGSLAAAAAVRRSARRGAVLAAVAALAVSGCSGSRSHAGALPDRGSVPVSPAHSAVLSMAGGVHVSVPTGSVTRAGKLTGTIISAPATAPGGMALTGHAYRLQLTGTRLTGQVRLTLPVPAPRQRGVLAGPDAVLLAFYDTATGQWQPVPASYDPSLGTITAVSSHLSVWTVLRLDTGKILAAATRALQGFIGIASTTGQPSCPGSADLTADGITVASDKGSLVKWCAGTNSASSPLLQVADNRSYALDTSFPSGWFVQAIGPADPVTEQIITSVARVLSPAPGGAASVIIPGGHAVQFTVPTGTSGETFTSPSAEAYLIDAFLYGADTLAMTFGDIPGAPSSDPSRTARAISLAFTAGGCLTQIDAIAHGSVSTARAAGELFRADVELAVGCLGDQWKAAYGIRGFIGQFIVSVALWLADGIKLVLTGLQAAIDSGIYWRSYRIALSQVPGPVLTVYLPCCAIPGRDQNPTADHGEDYRPRTVSFDATGSHVLQNASWPVWNATEAIAVGTAAINSCEPACAGGRYNYAPVTVTFSEPRKCGRYTFWSEAVWHFPDSIPPGEIQDQTDDILFGC